jgi:general secretion pathway protein F
MRFHVKAFRDKSSITRLLVEAVSADEAARVVQRQGTPCSASVSVPGGRFAGHDAQRVPLAVVQPELYVLLEAGLSLIEAIETLAEKELHAHTREALAEIIRHLYEAGRSHMRWNNRRPVSLPSYIAMVRASEKTGDLPQALTRFVAYETQIEHVRKKIVNASIYPSSCSSSGAWLSFF